MEGGLLKYKTLKLPYDLVSCDKTRFNGESEVSKKLNFSGTYKCPKDFNYKLSGGFSNTKMDYIAV